MLALGIPAAHATETLLLSSFSTAERKLFFKALATLAYEHLGS